MRRTLARAHLRGNFAITLGAPSTEFTIKTVFGLRLMLNRLTAVSTCLKGCPGLA
ncbi:MAG TPA: hypothetical protein VGU23_06555 [Acidobacteriaceae bacterium]|nr:hypothetical protein [Acidobacteriaceae bacterium]